MSQKNSPYSCVSPEEIERDCDYAISYNPDDSHQHWHKDSRVTLCEEFMRNLLWTINKWALVDVQMEVSKQGRLHFHGTIKVQDVRGFFVFAIRRLQDNGTYCIKTIDDQKAWQEYCTKQSNLFGKASLPRLSSPREQLYGVVKGLKKFESSDIKKKISLYDEDDFIEDGREPGREA